MGAAPRGAAGRRARAGRGPRRTVRPDEPAPEEPGAPGDAAARPGLGAVAEPPDRDEGAGPAAAERPGVDDPLGRLAGELGEEAEGGDEPWAEAVARRAERHRADGRPFVVLAIEVDDVERLLAADRGGDAARAVARVEAALREELRTADVVLRERPGACGSSRSTSPPPERARWASAWPRPRAPPRSTRRR